MLRPISERKKRNIDMKRFKTLTLMYTNRLFVLKKFNMLREAIKTRSVKLRVTNVNGVSILHSNQTSSQLS